MLASLVVACAKSAPPATAVAPITLPTPVADAAPVAIEQSSDDAGAPDAAEAPPEDNLPRVFSSHSIQMGNDGTRRFDLEIHGKCNGPCTLAAGAAVSAFMSDRSEDVDACFASSSSHATAMVTLEILFDGTVRSADLVMFTGSENNASCLVDVLNRYHFPSADKPGSSMTLRFVTSTDVEPSNNP
jgi:hypothetical protein